MRKDAGAACLAVAQDGMGLVGLLEAIDFVGGELELQGGEGVFELVELAGADDGGGDGGFGHDPGEGDLGGPGVARFGDLDDAVDDVEVGVFAVEAVGVGVGAGADGF